MTIAQLQQHQPILFYDGVCNLCNYWVKFVLKKEKRPVLTFAALQSEAGDAVKTTFGNNPVPDSLMVYANGKVYTKASAALYLTRYLRGAWPLLGVLYIFPSFLRNWGYDIIARNRYRWFGQKDECMIPSPEVRKRFLM